MDNLIYSESYIKKFNLLDDVKSTTEDKDFDKIKTLIEYVNEYKKNGFKKIKYGLKDPDLTPEIKIDIDPNDKIFKSIGYQNFYEMESFLNKSYAKSIGFECFHIDSVKEKTWFESQTQKNYVTDEIYKTAYEILFETFLFENFLQTKYIGKKRFSIEGLDAIIPGIDLLIRNIASENKTNKTTVIIGSSHRGRISIMANILKMKMADIFAIFDESVGINDKQYTYDVKYHNGFLAKNLYKNIDAIILNNPSHLESIMPVCMGYKRAMTDDFINTFGIILHGDASFCGQGVVFESLQMEKISGFDQNGNIHIIANNNIGFTANPDEYKSSQNVASIGKAFDIPILHINADNIGGVLNAFWVALLYKLKFKKSIILNVIGYRRYGHNESDDPSYTQPSLYKTIKSHKPVHEILEKEINITENFKNDIENKIREKLKSEYEKSKKQNFKKEFLQRAYKNKTPPKQNDDLNNKFVIQYLKSFEKIDLHSKIKKQYADKRQKFAKDKKLDWATAESLAFFNILKHKNIRISGQDSIRGTFSHRHAKPVNAKEEYENIILKVSNDMGHKNDFQIQNTLLSEYAAMGFEYGYSLYNPDQNYVIWEAQFGDFANGAQIIIDQYIASSYYKWSDMSNIALLLPHGYEGQGPEHSSGRIERFLQLCANHNMYVCCPSDSTNYAAMLYFHAILSIKCPMVIFTPKSLLRSSDSFGRISDMKNRFQKIIYDKKATKVKSIIFCTGKIYYEIKDIIEKISLIVRIEQLFPFPKEDIKQILNKHKKANLIWIQEEPKNMGAYTHIKNNLVGIDLKYIGRDEMAVTAEGLLKSHKKEQERIIGRVKKL